MKLTAKVQILPNDDQAMYLKQTLERANAACNAISDYAWEHQAFGQYTLHKTLYYDIRSLFGLAALVAVRCFAKVGDAYKLDKKHKRTFKPYSAIAHADYVAAVNIGRRGAVNHSYCSDTPYGHGFGTAIPSLWAAPSGVAPEQSSLF
jgi:predicted transposase